VEKVRELDPEELTAPFVDRAGVYNLAFTLDPRDQLFYTDELTGVTVAGTAPIGSSKLWDYTKCDGRSSGWQPKEAIFRCASNPQAPPVPGTSYASFNPASVDGNLLMPDLRVDLSEAASDAGAWVRLGVCARLPAKQKGRLGEWFWGTPPPASGYPPGWSQERSHAFPLDSTGEWRNYWTYLPAGRVGKQLEGLRFDPVNDRLPVDIQWVSLDFIR
jgi:hypothetical protein